jgi:NADPH:quinone reductase-like Zn-dependent oxidoreductase
MLDGKGVDIVVDVVGASQIDTCLRALNEGGVVSAIGRLEGTSTREVSGDEKIVPILVGNRI